MSGHSHKSNFEKTTRTETSARDPRRGMSVHDKMEEARARRAALLQAGTPANTTKAVSRATPRVARRERKASVAPVSTAVTELPPASIAEKPAPAVAIAPPEVSRAAAAPRAAATGRMTAFLSSGLSLLLLGLGVLVYSVIDRPTPVSAPEFAPPRVSLLPTGLGEPLLLSLPGSLEPAGDAVPRQAVVAPPEPVVERVPADTLASNRGPRLADSVTPPVQPDARPASIMILKETARPRIRP